MKRIVMAALLVGCSGNDGDVEIDINGDWSEDWTCEQTCDGVTETITGSVLMTLAESGGDVTRTDDDGTQWTGTLDGLVLDLTTTSGDYTEDSVFTFAADGTSFTVTSEYSFGVCTGDCTGTGERL